MRKVTSNNIVIYLKILLLLLITNTSLYSQNLKQKTDTLKMLLKFSKLEITQAEVLIQLAELFSSNNFDSSKKYASYALEKANKVKNIKLINDANYLLGVAFKNKGVIDSANLYLFKSLEISRAIYDYDSEIKTRIAIGEFFRFMHKLKDAVIEVKKAVLLCNEKNLLHHLPSAYNRLGAIYFEIATSQDRTEAEFDTLEIAISYVNSSIDWSNKFNNQKFKGSNYNILGICYQNKKEYNLAIDFFKLALIEAEKKQEIAEKPMIYRNIGMNYFRTNQFDMALHYAKLGLQLSDSLRFKIGLLYNNFLFFITYQKLKKDAFALDYFKRTESIRALVYKENTENQINEFKIKYQNRENELMLKQKEIEINNRQKRELVILISLSFTIILIFIGIFQQIKIRKNNKLLKKINIEVESKALQLSSALKKLATLKQFKDDLNSMLIHDLKNPLSNILAKTSDKYIINAARKMLNLLMNMLDIEKYEDAEMKIKKDKFSLKKIIQTVILYLETILEQKNIQIVLHFDDYIVIVDEEIIERVFENLLSNAIRFSPLNKNIEIFAIVLPNNQVKISIKNYGENIPDDKLFTIFEKYQQAAIFDTFYYKSTGLGLAFCKLALDSHNQLIVARNLPDGVMFDFTLDYDCAQNIENKDNMLNHGFLCLLNKEEHGLISSYIIELQNIPINNASEIFSILNKIPEHTDSLKKWKNKVRSSVFSVNNELYANLIKL